MSSFGVLPTGIKIKTIDDILTEIQDSHKSKLGAGINTSLASKIGDIDGTFAVQVADLWELGEGIYNALYPPTALGSSLDNVGAFTGAERIPASQSQVVLQVNLTAGTPLLAGRVVSRSASGDRYTTTADVTNSTGARAVLNVAAQSEEFGIIPGAAFTIDSIETPVSGWQAKAAVVSVNSETFTLVNGMTLDLAVDLGATQQVTFLTADFADIANATAAEVAAAIVAGTAGVEAEDALGQAFVQSATDGPGSAIQITGGTSNAILGFPITAVAGLNKDDATPGALVESDINYRIRRESLIRLPGAATVESLRAALLNTAGVLQAFVFENRTLITDTSGIPGKAFEAVVFGGADIDIAQTIFAKGPLGIESHRDPGAQGVTVVVTDSQGIAVNINFTRPTTLQMFSEVDLYVDLKSFGGGDQIAGEQQVRDSLAVIGASQNVGDNVVILKYKCSPISITGVIDVCSMKIESTFPPTNTLNIPITSRQISKFDTSDMVVNVSVVPCP